jgi:hypothetical protein
MRSYYFIKSPSPLTNLLLLHRTISKASAHLAMAI